MDPNQIVSQSKVSFQTAIDYLYEELKRIRTGRASAGMLDGILVTAYGVSTPLRQLANVTAPEAQLLQITPFDPSNLATISATIRDNPSLGLNPMDDGRVIRVPVPPLTEERRREIVKMLGSKVEDCMITLRNIRRDAMEAIDKAKKDKLVGEDDAKRLSKQVDDAMTQVKLQAEASAATKTEEIMTL